MKVKLKSWIKKAVMIGVALFSAFPAFAQHASIKPLVRDFFGKLSEALNETGELQYPDGMTLVSAPGVKGIRLESGKFFLEPHVWNTPEGLIDQIQKLNARGEKVLAGINGAFYTPTGVLGPVIIQGKVPAGVKQIIPKHPKCYLGLVVGNHGQRWVMGETTQKADDLALLGLVRTAHQNRIVEPEEHLMGLLGGGGWIIRQKQDVHMEAYQRQNFRFRKVDQDSRHTVVAMDIFDNLYLLVFETGANLENVSRTLLSNVLCPKNGFITDAFFYDGGSSSTLVAQGQYLVPPMYLVDKARFSALLVKQK